MHWPNTSNHLECTGASRGSKDDPPQPSATRDGLAVLLAALVTAQLNLQQSDNGGNLQSRGRPDPMTARGRCAKPVLH